MLQDSVPDGSYNDPFLSSVCACVCARVCVYAMHLYIYTHACHYSCIYIYNIIYDMWMCVGEVWEVFFVGWRSWTWWWEIMIRGWVNSTDQKRRSEYPELPAVFAFIRASRFWGIAEIWMTFTKICTFCLKGMTFSRNDSSPIVGEAARLPDGSHSPQSALWLAEQVLKPVGFSWGTGTGLWIIPVFVWDSFKHL